MVIIAIGRTFCALICGMPLANSRNITERRPAIRSVTAIGLLR